MKNRPWLSIIIPCHNSCNTIGATLESIVTQGIDKELLEIILVDDDSNQPYTSVIDKYRGRLNIIDTKTDVKVHCPGNTRQAGMQYISGEWLTFIDHDDIFESGSFKKIRSIIKQKGEKTFVFTNLREYDLQRKQYINFNSGSMSKTWLHGKFYSVDNLIRKYNIHFCNDLTSHEDLYFNQMVFGCLEAIGYEIKQYSAIYTYRWNAHPESLSRSWQSKTGHTYLEYYFEDYLLALQAPYANLIKQFGMVDAYKANMMSEVVYCYLYMQSFKFIELYSKQPRLERNDAAAKRFIQNVIKFCKLTPELLIECMIMNVSNYNKIRFESFSAIGLIVETEGIGDFIWNYSGAAEYVQAKPQIYVPGRVALT